MTSPEDFRGCDPDAPVLLPEVGPETAAAFVFMLQESLYSLPSAVIDLVAPVGSFVRVPGTAAHILGVTQVRDRIVAVVDLHALLNLEASVPASHDTRARMVVITIDRTPFATIVDSVLGMHEVPVGTPSRGARAIEEPLPSLCEGRFELLAGVVTRLSPRALLLTIMSRGGDVP